MVELDSRQLFCVRPAALGGVCHGTDKGALYGHYNRSVDVYQDPRRAAIGPGSGYAGCESACFGKLLGRIRPASNDGHAEDAAAWADALTGLRLVPSSS